MRACARAKGWCRVLLALRVRFCTSSSWIGTRGIDAWDRLGILKSTVSIFRSITDINHDIFVLAIDVLML